MTNFEDAYEQTGHGKFNILALLTSGCILLYVTMECLGMGFVLNLAECDLKISTPERGFIAASTFIGVVSTAIFWGYLGDACGRRRVMLPALMVAMMCSFVSSLCTGFWIILIFRLLTGSAVSASIATVYAFLSEMQPKSHRASSVAFASAFISVSFVTMPSIAWVILPQTWSFPIAGNLSVVPWRVFMWSWVCFGLVACIGLFILPESPRYILVYYGPEKAMTILAEMYAWNNNKKREEYPVTEIESLPYSPITFMICLKKLKHLLRPPLLRCVCISHICIFLLFFQTNSYYMWLPHIVNKVLSHPTSSVSMCYVLSLKGTASEVNESGECKVDPVDTRMYPISMAMGVLTAIMYLTIGFIIDKFGRKKVYCGLVIVCSAITLTSGVVPNLYAALTLLIPGLCGGAATSVIATIAVEIFPTSLRVMALCTLFMVARFGAAMGSWILGIGLYSHCVIVSIWFTMMTAASTLLMLFWPDGAKVRAQMEERDFTY